MIKDQYSEFITKVHFRRYKIRAYSSATPYKSILAYSNKETMLKVLQESINDPDVFLLFLIDEHLNIKIQVKDYTGVNVPLDGIKGILNEQ